MKSSCIPSYPSENIGHFSGQIFYIAWTLWGSVHLFNYYSEFKGVDLLQIKPVLIWKYFIADIKKCWAGPVLFRIIQ